MIELKEKFFLHGEHLFKDTASMDMYSPYVPGPKRDLHGGLLPF